MTKTTLTQRNRIRLFCTAFLQVMFVACSTVFIARQHTAGIAASGFAVSLIWTLNVRQVAIGSWTDRIIYATGAACGSVCGAYMAAALFRLL
jgi:hypothetical protein